MATKGSTPVAIGPWMGLWDRNDTAPQDHFEICDDSMFLHETVYPRPPFVQVKTLAARPLRSFPFKLSSNPIGSRWLVLATNPGGGSVNVYDAIVGGASTLIISGLSTTITDFSVLVVFDRAYISFHNQVVGEAFHPIYVWDPSTMSVGRPAAGFAPTGTFTVVVSATNGHIEPGLHILAVSYETNTGHVTVPGLYGSITAPGGTQKKLDLTVIPVGPTGTVARHILMSKTVNNFDGNFQHPQLFFAKRIADNTTTALTGTNGLDVYDTELIASADYLKDQHEAIPSGVSLCMYSSRVVVGNVNIPIPSVPGLPPLPPKAERSLIIASGQTDIESFSKLEGFRQINKSEGGGIKQLSEVNGILYARKSFMTFALQDNGLGVNKWPISNLDVAGGTEAHGIATFPGTSAGSTKGVQLVCDRAGLYVFDGAYQPRPLTWKVEGIWRTIDPGRFAEIMVTVDPERNRLAVLLPPHVAGGITVSFTDHILMGDFQFGLDPDNIRWSYWQRIVTGTNKDCVGLNFDYRESLIPSLTATLKDAVGVDSGEIQALPDDLLLTATRRSMILQYAVPMHPDGGFGTLVAVRHRFCRLTNPAVTYDLDILNQYDAADPNPFMLHLLTPQNVIQGFNRFKNDYRPVGRGMMEQAMITLSTSGYGLVRGWVFVNPNMQEQPTGG